MKTSETVSESAKCSRCDGRAAVFSAGEGLMCLAHWAEKRGWREGPRVATRAQTEAILDRLEARGEPVQELLGRLAKMPEDDVDDMVKRAADDEER